MAEGYDQLALLPVQTWAFGTHRTTQLAAAVPHILVQTPIRLPKFVISLFLLVQTDHAKYALLRVMHQAFAVVHVKELYLFKKFALAYVL